MRRPRRDSESTTGLVQLRYSFRRTGSVAVDHDNQDGIHVSCAERPRLVRILLANELLTRPFPGRRGNHANSVIGPAFQKAIDKHRMLLVFTKNDYLRRLHGVQPRAWTSDIRNPVSFFGSMMRVWLSGSRAGQTVL